MTMERSVVVSVLTIVDVVAVLLPGTGSVVVLETDAVLAIVPGWDGVTVIVTVAVAPAATAPRLQVTVATPEQVPTLVDDDPKLTPAGSVSVTVTVPAALGPLLLTVRVYVSGLPASAGLGEPVFVIDRSADVPTVVEVEAVLLPPLGSDVVDDNEAVFETVPAVVGATAIVTVADPPLAIVPRLQETVAAPAHVPCVDDVETNVTPEGSGSLTATSAAGLGPAFERVSV